MEKHAKRKAFGQHFLRDPSVISRIVEAAIADPGPVCLEIGPGRGAITEPLFTELKKRVDSGKAPTRVLLVEKDRALAVENERRISALGATDWASVVCADFLELKDSAWFSPGMSVVSNLPYSSGTAILTRLAAQDGIRAMTLMFQAEVAERVRAEGGVGSGRDRGSLSIWIQNRWDVERVCRVKPGAFRPPPKVDSEVIRLVPRPKSRIEIRDPERWERLLKACFAHRRKMLRSGLQQTEFAAALQRSGVDGTLRPQELDWEQWERLAHEAGVSGDE